MKILIVDDEPAIARGAARLLQQEFNCVCVPLYDPRLLAETLASDGPFDVVLSDFRMPWKFGNEVLQEVARLSPKSGLILWSGGTGMVSTIEDVALNECPVGTLSLRKPFLSENLFRAVRQALTNGETR